MEQPLTERQLEVVVYLANGFRVDEIAKEMNFSRGSIEKTLTRARKRARARTNAHLVSLIIASGVLQWNPDESTRMLNGNG